MGARALTEALVATDLGMLDAEEQTARRARRARSASARRTRRVRPGAEPPPVPPLMEMDEESEQALADADWAASGGAFAPDSRPQSPAPRGGARLASRRGSRGGVADAGAPSLRARLQGDMTSELQQLTSEASALDERMQQALARLGTEDANADPAMLTAFYDDHRRFLAVSYAIFEQLERMKQVGQRKHVPDVQQVLARVWDVGFVGTLQTVYDTLAQPPAPSASVRGVLGEEVPQAQVLVNMTHNIPCDIYALAGNLCECSTDRQVRRTAVQWLAALATHLLALQSQAAAAAASGPSSRSAATTSASRALTVDECEAWRSVALMWWGLAALDTPQEGRLYCSIAQVDDADDLTQAYWLCKSVQVARSSAEARDALAVQYAREGQDGRTLAAAPDLFCHALGMLAARATLDALPEVLARLHGTLPGAALAETAWMQLGMCTVAAVLELGRADAAVSLRLLGAHLATGVERRVPADMETQQARLAACAAASEAPLAERMDAAPAALPRPLAGAAQLLLVVLDATLQAGAPAVPARIILLSFVYALALRARGPGAIAVLCGALRAWIPWAALARSAHEGPVPALVERAGGELPEDWAMRGAVWDTAGAPFFGGRDVGFSHVAVPSASAAPAAKSIALPDYTFSTETEMWQARSAAARRARLGYAGPDEAELAERRAARASLLAAVAYGRLVE